MHRRYAADGLVCISVSVDDPKNKAKALAFLAGQRATFPNYWIDEKEDFWQEKWNINAPPAMFVFDRQGRRAARFDHNDPRKNYVHTDVEKLVRLLLRVSPGRPGAD
jgi:hypothetical protein